MKTAGPFHERYPSLAKYRMPTLPSTQAADAYHAARQNTVWTGLGVNGTATKTAALHRAQDYITARYTFLPDTGDHVLIAQATIMLAGEMIEPQSLRDKNAGISKSSKTLEGTGTIQLEFDSSAGDPFPLITAVLKPILASVPGAFARSVRLVL